MQIFLLIWVITHIIFYELTQHYSLTRGCFGERAIVTYFRSLQTLAFFAKYVNLSARCIKISFKPIECLRNAAYERLQSTGHVCGGAFHRNFQKEKLSESAVVIHRF